MVAREPGGVNSIRMVSFSEIPNKVLAPFFRSNEP